MTNTKPSAHIAVMTALVLCISLLATPVRAEGSIDDDAGEGAVILDLLVLRPIGLITTVIGGVVYVALVPFTLPTGNLKKSFKVFVKKPVAYTFARELGEPRP